MTSSTADLPGTPHPFVWSHGRAEIWPLSAAIHNLELRLPDGRLVRPLAEAPWHGEAEIADDASIPAHLRHLGGEWPCVPFGRSAADPVVHGYGTDNPWRLLRGGRDSSTWEIIYPSDRPIERLRRDVTGVHGHAAVDFVLTTVARRDVTLPVGLHPILRLPEPGGSLSVEGAYSHGETFPVVFEAGISRLAAAARFASTAELPLAAGGAISLSQLAPEVTEEAFQLFGVDGDLRIVYPKDGYALRLNWDARDFPTCLFWLSAGGRAVRPWGGRFRGMGVEPLDARFEASGGAGVIAGGRHLRAGEVWTTRYRISVEPA
jgi:hypothetical protein